MLRFPIWHQSVSINRGRSTFSLKLTRLVLENNNFLLKPHNQYQVIALYKFYSFKKKRKISSSETHDPNVCFNTAESVLCRFYGNIQTNNPGWTDATRVKGYSISNNSSPALSPFSFSIIWTWRDRGSISALKLDDVFQTETGWWVKLCRVKNLSKWKIETKTSSGCRSWGETLRLD